MKAILVMREKKGEFEYVSTRKKLTRLSSECMSVTIIYFE